MKYYQTSLEILALTLTNVEKSRVEVLTKQCLMQHRNFLKNLANVERKTKKVLEIIAVNDYDYDNSKKLFILLRMRNLI